MQFQLDNINKYEYISRVNRVMDYIDDNIDKNLTLAMLSRVAYFSEYHFHRIFKSITQESVNKYIQRIRVEKAAAQLLFNPKKKITDIAFDSGFSSSQFFSRVFRQYFAISASNWRLAKTSDVEVMDEQKKTVLADKVVYSYDCRQMPQLPGLFQPVRVKNLPATYMAYTREIGVYTGYLEVFSRMFMKLSRWSKFRKLNNADTRIIAVFRDQPVITEKSRLRLTLCLPVDGDIYTGGDIGMCKIQSGEYAVGRFELAENELERAWKSMYCEWLPKSGYQLGDGPPLEFFLNYPDKHPYKKFIVDICIPVKIL